MTNEGSIRIGSRTVAYLEAGDPDGPLVLHNHGGPSSRLEAALFDAAASAHGLRFVGVDRPGIGGSDPHPGRSYASWAGDLVHVADALGANRFAVTGWSEGGPWALAAAAYIDPARLVHAANIGGGCYGTFGPNWAAEHLSSADALGGRLALHFRPGFKLMYELLGLSATHFAQSYGKALLKAVNDADRAVLADEEVMKLFLDASRECFRQGADGLVVDATLLYDAWPFDVTKIERPVHFWQGTGDTLVPVVINRTVAERTPGAVWHGIEGGGHFIALGNANDILALAASDLAAVAR